MFNHKQRAASNVWNMALLGLVAMASAAIVMVVSRSDIFGKRGNDLPGAFVLDANKFRSVDPALVTYRELPDARIDTGMKAPRGIALAPNGRVFVAGDADVKIFTPDGKVERSFPVGGESRCIALSADAATIYVGVGDHVETYNAQGQKQASWPAPAAGASITCITVFEDNILGAYFHRKSGRVVRYDRAGKPLNEIASYDDANAAEPFTTPSAHLDVVVGPDGLLRVGNPGKLRVETYTLEGQPRPELNWGVSATVRAVEGFMPCCNPTDLAMLADGSFVTAEKGVPRVKVYDPSGKFTGVVARPDDFAPNAAGLDLAADKAGRIYVLDPDARAVRVFVSKQAK